MTNIFWFNGLMFLFLCWWFKRERDNFRLGFGIIWWYCCLLFFWILSNLSCALNTYFLSVLSQGEWKKTFSGFKVWFNCSGFNHITCISNFNFYLFGIITKQFRDTIQIKLNSKPTLYKIFQSKHWNINLKIYH